MRIVLRLSAVAASAMVLAACATKPAPVVQPTAPKPPPQATNSDEPPGIAGLAAQNLRAAYGAPAFVRKDGTAQIWRYDGASCKAFFFLYAENGALAVRHVETVPRGTKWAADPACLNALRAPASQPVS